MPPLLAQCRAEREHASGAEELDGADLAELAPLGAVGREEDALGARLDGEAGHAAEVAGGEVDVVGDHELTRGVCGGGDDDGQAAEAEKQERAVALRQVTQGAVRQVPRQVEEVAEQRERPR